ncbi:hypothetical protein ACROYT_G025954 [Oculina patagonica]
MTDTNSYSGDEYSDGDEEEEELDPRVQDELEKLNVAANSINHLEAELDEARAVFRQTMAAATYHLNAQAHKLGKCIDKARPFYDVLREMRKAHFELQKATLQFEKANSRHVYARQRVHEAEQRVFSSVEKRAFDTALQEMLNQATIEVNEAENQKKESWSAHQKMYKSYQEVETKAKTMQNKLKKSVEKARPYFVQKVAFDRHLWQLKLRVDSIHTGLSEAKVNYSKCLRSLEIISDDIHRKRKDKKMLAMIANLQEREAGVGADSEDETSLDQSQLDLDLDCNSSLSEVDGILPGNLPDLPPLPGKGMHLPSGEEGPSGASTSAAELGMERSVSGAESTDSVDSDSRASLSRSGSLKREVYGCEHEESEVSECSSKDVKTKETGQIKEVPNTIGDTTATSTLPKADNSDVSGDEKIVDKSVNASEEIASSISEAAEAPEQNKTAVTTEDTAVDNAHVGDEVVEENKELESEKSISNESTQNQECTSSDCVSTKASDDSVLETEDKQVSPSETEDTLVLPSETEDKQIFSIEKKNKMFQRNM